MSAELGIRLKVPPHVGGFIKHEILAHLELTVTDAARALGVARPALSGLLNEHVGFRQKWCSVLKWPLGFRWMF